MESQIIIEELVMFYICESYRFSNTINQEIQKSEGV